MPPAANLAIFALVLFDEVEKGPRPSMTRFAARHSGQGPRLALGRTGTTVSFEKALIFFNQQSGLSEHG